MRITPDEAVVMFARYCAARFGGSASRKARTRAKALQKHGDAHGHEIWNRVADEIDKGAKSKPRARRGRVN